VLVDIALLRDHPAAVEATRRRAEAVLGYADASGSAGTLARVLPHLRNLCTREPLNEQAHASLMLALAATGHQAPPWISSPACGTGSTPNSASPQAPCSPALTPRSSASRYLIPVVRDPDLDAHCPLKMRAVRAKIALELPLLPAPR